MGFCYTFNMFTSDDQENSDISFYDMKIYNKMINHLWNVINVLL